MRPWLKSASPGVTFVLAPASATLLLVVAVALSSCDGNDTTPTSTPAPTVEQPAGPLVPLEVEPAFPNLSLDRMVYLTHAGDGTDRLFVLLQPGRIMLFPNDQSVQSATVFLDIRERVSDRGNEEGLLGLAFDPDYATSGHLYLYYTASAPRRSVVSRFSVHPDDPNRADPASEHIILEVPQPFANHNGGMLAFGSDGLLYIGLGDGGSAGDPQGNGQDPGSLLGSILRIDPGSPGDGRAYSIPPDNPFVGREGFRDEVWAYGLRNPWRFSFDSETADLWAGDVGQNGYEEVDIIRPGRNYGWNIMEGLHCFLRICDQTGLDLPIIEYPLNGDNCAVTGGYVYRGSRLLSLYGAYVYGDFCSGRIWALRHDGQSVTEQRLLADTSLRIPSFGQDASRELYILSFDGAIYRLKTQE